MRMMTRFVQLVGLFSAIMLYLAIGSGSGLEWSVGPHGEKRLALALRLEFPKPLMAQLDASQRAFTGSLASPLEHVARIASPAGETRPPEPQDPRLADLPQTAHSAI
ncbi:MAG: hypothetical protein IPK79_01775 [Vampirovibrionales bacterium]|nr:hypothetical protein [Vampirovibrionales bacterium]